MGSWRGHLPSFLLLSDSFLQREPLRPERVLALGLRSGLPFPATVCGDHMPGRLEWVPSGQVIAPPIADVRPPCLSEAGLDFLLHHEPGPGGHTERA